MSHRVCAMPGTMAGMPKKPVPSTGLRRSALENRRFPRRVVRFLAAEAGVSQFLDIGVGLPTQGAVRVGDRLLP
jgi:hypothetical protein